MTETNVDAAASIPEDFLASIKAASAVKDPTAYVAVLVRVSASVPPMANGFKNKCWQIPGFIVVELQRKTGPNWYTLVDDNERMRDILTRYRFGAGAQGYAVCWARLAGNAGMVYLHALVRGTAPPGYDIDHRDRIRLNNTDENLRVLSTSQNNINSNRQTNNHSGRTGVYRDETAKRWVVQWCAADRTRHRERFADARYSGAEAARKAACEYRDKIERSLAHYTVALGNPAPAGENVSAPVPAAIPVAIEPLPNRHTNGVPGLVRHSVKRQWIAQLKNPSTGKRKCRAFSDSAHGGSDGAKAKAIAALAEMRLEFAAAAAAATEATEDDDPTDESSEEEGDDEPSDDEEPPAKRQETVVVDAEHQAGLLSP
jgi:hypothetical protein